MQFISVEVFKYLYYIMYIFYYKALFVRVKDSTCLRIAIPAYCFTIFDQLLMSCFVYLITLSAPGYFCLIMSWGRGSHSAPPAKILIVKCF